MRDNLRKGDANIEHRQKAFGQLKGTVDLKERNLDDIREAQPVASKGLSSDEEKSQHVAINFVK